MKHTDTLMPYMLASMHPTLHLSLLTSGVVLYSFNTEFFLKVPNADQCTDKTALTFINEDKKWLVGYLSGAHLCAIVLHYMSDALISQNSKILGNLFMISKVFIYIFAVITVQTGILFKECRDGIVDSSQVMAWLNFEVLAFYLNITAMAVFLLVTSCKKFTSMKERIGAHYLARK